MDGGNKTWIEGVGRRTIMNHDVNIIPRCGSLNSVDKESIGLSGFVVVTLFKQSPDSK